MIKNKKTRLVGIIGIRGYKVIYSGFETLVRNLIKRAKPDLYYYVFSRTGYNDEARKGKNFNNIIINTLFGKYLETPIYALFSSLYSLTLPLDTVLYLSVANTPFIWLQKIMGRRVIVNVDGLDWKRSRWSLVGKLYLLLCETITVKYSDHIIADSKYVYEYYKKKYHVKHIQHLIYGADVSRRKPDKVLKRLKLIKNKYIVFVGRLTPENCVEEVIESYIRLGKILKNHKCVVVGDSFFEEKYKQKLIRLASGHQILFTGMLIGKDYEEILSNSFCYIESKSVGGVHPSLIEAMLLGNAIISKDLPEHREALDNSALFYSNKEELIINIKKLITSKKKLLLLKRSAEKRATRFFRWEKVVESYEGLY
jgi:glycosyltransferase involved in cell wall biosynthesis